MSRYGTLRGPSNSLLFVIVGIILVVAGIIVWVFASQGGPRMTADDKRVAEKIKAGTLTSQDLEGAAQQGIAELNKLTGESAKPTAPGASSTPAVVPAGFRTGNWNETIQGKYGPVTVDYQITGPANRKIATQLGAINGYAHINSQNITNVPVRLTFTAIDTNANGVVLDTLKIDRVLDPGEIDNLSIGMPGGTNLKIRAEAN